MDLAEIGRKYRTDKVDHNYMPYYETHLGAITGTLLEIGVAGGASLQTWMEYFPEATVIGVEKYPKGMPHGLHVIIGDGTLPETYLQPTGSEYVLDWTDVQVVIDDGSHQAEDVYNALKNLWPLLPEGAWYVVEDLATQFDAGCGGVPGVGSKATDLLYEYLKLAIRSVCPEVTEFHAYEEICFIKKGR